VRLIHVQFTYVLWERGEGGWCGGSQLQQSSSPRFSALLGLGQNKVVQAIMN
jgi:hypothetical protein